MKPVISRKKTQRNSQSDRQDIIKKTSIKIKKKSRHDTVEYENPENIRIQLSAAFVHNSPVEVRGN